METMNKVDPDCSGAAAAKSLTANERELMEHALGLNYHRTSFRNHFVTGPGSTDWDAWQSLVDRGFAVRREPSPISGGDYVFTVTDEGKSVLAKFKPEKSKSKSSQSPSSP